MDRWATTITLLVERYKALGKACSEYLNVGALTPETPLYDEIWNMFEFMVGQIDRDDWINWYIFENDCGKKQLAASASSAKQPRKIKTARDIARLIVESEDIEKRK